MGLGNLCIKVMVQLPALSTAAGAHNLNCRKKELQFICTGTAACTASASALCTGISGLHLSLRQLPTACMRAHLAADSTRGTTLRASHLSSAAVTAIGDAVLAWQTSTDRRPVARPAVCRLHSQRLLSQCIAQHDF
jgi:hypothetical protein